MIKLTKSERKEQAISLNPESTKLLVSTEITSTIEFTFIKKKQNTRTPKYHIGYGIYINALYIWQHILDYLSTFMG
jgi:hypothetical protein